MPQKIHLQVYLRGTEYVAGVGGGIIRTRGETDWSLVEAGSWKNSWLRDILAPIPSSPGCRGVQPSPAGLELAIR